MAEADKNQAGTPTTPVEQEPVVTAELPEEVKAKLAELDSMKQAVEERQAKLDEQWQEFQRERAQQREELRREKVEVFLKQLETPDAKGFKLDKGVMDILRPVLLNDPIETEGEATIQLSDEPSTGSVHAYYREALLRLSEKIPRTVPTGSQIQAGSSTNPRTRKDEVNEERAQKRAAMQLARAREHGIENIAQLSEEDKKEIEEKLDLIYGKEE